MHEVLLNRLGGLSLPRKSVVSLTDRPDMTLDVYCGRKTTMQQQQQILFATHRLVMVTISATLFLNPTIHDKAFGWTGAGFTEACAQSLNANCYLDF